jgi:hypothetical protein
MRHSLAALGCVLLMAGVALAAEVTLIKYEGDKKAVTVKEGDAEKTYKLTDKTKVTFVIDKDGNTRNGTVEAAAKVLGSDTFKGKKFEITSDKDTITELKLKGGKRLK